MEVWKQIKDWEGYEVSNQGRVRSFKGKTPRILKMGRHPKGYLSVVLSKRAPARTKSITVHRLVMETFVGPRPEGNLIRHLNDIKTDNRLENLSFGTYRQNAEDSWANGYCPRKNRIGLKTHNAKLTPIKQKFIRQNIGVLSFREMGRRLEVSHKTISSFVNGGTYR